LKQFCIKFNGKRQKAKGKNAKTKNKQMILVLTTLFHLLATIPPLMSDHPFRYAYSSIVVGTTSMSALWHWKGQSPGIYQYLDYSFTAIWFFYDIHCMSHLSYIEKLKILIASFFLVWIHELCSAEQNYKINHSLWHIISSAKCLYVSYLLFRVAP
jgi:hypothetical protein